MDDLAPAYSPDGEQIAFRSERDGGGLYVMGATGESVRRLTDFGHNPAWSPDGKEIIFTTEKVLNPYGRNTVSQLWSVRVADGQRKMLSKGDAVQPNVSPHNLRIAYWAFDASGRGQRDIWTIPAGGGEPIAVTKDPAVDWSPVWSPDGKYLYFSSDRGGSLNIWRVPIDEKSGKVQGDPEPMTTPSENSAQMSFSRDGKQMIFSSFIGRVNIEKISFDPQKQTTTGNPVEITHGTASFVAPDPSPDGEWIAFWSSGSQEDIYLVRQDGTDLRKLTDDTFKDRTPRWSPDGKQIAFYSNRGGRMEIWSIRPDGSGLQRIAKITEGDLYYPIWSPDQTRIAATADEYSLIFDISGSLPAKTSQKLPPLGKAEAFEPTSWSPDGKWLAGLASRPDGSYSDGIVIYSFESGKYEKLADFKHQSLGQSGPAWLKDSRTVLL